MDIAMVNHPGLAVSAVPDARNQNWLLENQQLIQMVKQVNAPELFGQNSELSFARDQETKRPVVRIIDRRTNQVVMQLPPEYVLRMAEAFGSVQGNDTPGAKRVNTGR
jgi:uncharacterized FlaG/YvyC family protein